MGEHRYRHTTHRTHNRDGARRCSTPGCFWPHGKCPTHTRLFEVRPSEAVIAHVRGWSHEAPKPLVRLFSKYGQPAGEAMRAEPPPDRSEPPEGYYVAGGGYSWNWWCKRVDGSGCSRGSRAEAVAACWAEHDKQSATPVDETCGLVVGQAVAVDTKDWGHTALKFGHVAVLTRIYGKPAGIWADVEMANGKCITGTCCAALRPLDLSRLEPCRPGELKAGDRVVALRSLVSVRPGTRLDRGHAYTIERDRGAWLNLVNVADGWSPQNFARLPAEQAPKGTC